MSFNFNQIMENDAVATKNSYLLAKGWWPEEKMLANG
jgi:hypothetical protein